ncbi:hypothetical protein BZA77DRAFT_290190 [Pyronema omphalodes]|nr:hypothetical protein BZA77DRAFT_290190 [Pyronema omphalodes]
MRPTRISLLFCAFVALCCCLHLVEGENPQGLLRRDDRLLPRQTDTPNSPTQTITDIPNTTGTISPKTTSDGSQRPSGTGKNNDISSASPAPTATDTSGSNDVFSPMGGKVYSGYGLPYEPRVTPGLAVAGVFLMIAGLGCCFIGIRIKRLHIFLSMAYLSGLSVTVLIVYVMNPPVRDAIEGAYVVAVIITGAILGALAVIFPEVTEGLGCLLGGFCLSMWFLVLKPGGLISSIYGKLTMIGTFCLVIFALAFHERTRPWGLITSLSFSGATSIMLGIDCFSRAGLKEFWLYIWALNDKIFPLQTNTFPHTRGMKVEIAGIIILFAVGVMSQMKLWKIIQARREAKDAIKRQHQADLDAIDEESGKRVEAENMVERERWEAAYGNQKETNTNTNTNDQDAPNVRPQTGASKTDSGLGGEEARESGETTERGVETNEMTVIKEEHALTEDMGEASGMPHQELPEGPQQQQQQQFIPLGTEDVPPSSPVAGRPFPQSPRLSDIHPALRGDSPAETGVSQPLQPADNSAEIPRAQPQNETLSARQSVPPPPTVIPLPLPVLHEDDNNDDNSDNSSVATRAESDRFDQDELYELVPVMPEMEFVNNRLSKDSSLAATCDVRLEEEDIEAPESAERTVDSSIDKAVDAEMEAVKNNEAVKESPRKSFQGPHVVPQHEGLQALGAPVGGAEDLEASSMEALTAGKAGDMRLRSTYISVSSSSPANDTVDESTSRTTPDITLNNTSLPPSKDESVQQAPSIAPQDLVPASYPRSKTSTSSVSRHEIQTQCSRVVKTYRTNEWAKHLAEADKPDPEELVLNPLEVEVEEKAAPLNINELGGTIITAPQAKLRRNSHLSKESSRDTSRDSISTPVPISPTTPAPRKAARRSSTNFNGLNPDVTHGGIEQTTQHVVPEKHVPFIERAPSAAAIRQEEHFPKQGTLLGQRESIVRNRASFNALAKYTPPPTAPSPIQTPPPAINRNSAQSAHMDPAQRSASAMSYRPVQTPQTSKPLQHRISSNILSDDMPLADRKQLLHQSVSMQTISQPHSGASYGVANIASSSHHQFGQIYQAGQAGQRRSNTPLPQHDKRADVMAAWREGIWDQQQSLQQQEMAVVDQRRREMLEERNREAAIERQRMVEGNVKAVQMEERMRQRDMLIAHQEAMRKIQRGVGM